MKYLLYFIFSLGAIYPATAQKTDSVKIKRTTGPELWVDYGKIVTYASDFESKIEVGLNWRIGLHWSPVLSIGTGDLTPEQAIKNGNYESKGWYFRAGIEYFIALNEKNRFIFGARYAKSAYDENGDYLIKSDLWQDVAVDFDRSGLTASWAELIVGSEMSLYKIGEDEKTRPSHWKLGGYFSVRFIIQRDKFEPVDTYGIPGYGRTIDKSVPGVQLYLKYSLTKSK